ncbi:MAG TPA: hypothetical protein VN213_18370 [Solirubrobacteraceae bacterium]|nr:hypothetical protein [Solirubrobacteraceae bacterium]
MSTTTMRDGTWRRTAVTLLLGLVLALAIAFAAGAPHAAWLGFALAETARGRATLARAARRRAG